ncbi:hypothetical protein QJS10_CPA03g01824 [Acorus calamus]|uniref:Uncharacterized protein n=1 Tax=Acorus calamus TaxID=4465 RepID=A0AAV9F661_ACOCL|nr:hypothetical protein QJS10_CPA03g01824 [Acorus calamus]
MAATTTEAELLVLHSLRASLGLRSRDWPHKSNPCSSCRVAFLSLVSLCHTHLSKIRPRFAIDGLANLTRLSSFDSSSFALPSPVPPWLGPYSLPPSLVAPRPPSLRPSPPLSSSSANLTVLDISGNSLTGSAGIVPKRHTKPQRSEYSTVYADALQPSDGAEDPIPELAKFQDLEAADPQTGTGFIKFESKITDVPHLVPDSDVFEHHESCKGNPATNEWIPAAETVIPVSSKPKRSDS